MLSKEQTSKIKEQLIKQIENLQIPDSQKSSMRAQIEEMEERQFEEFLIKNKLISIQNDNNKNNSGDKNEENPTSPFRLIVEGKIPSYKISENSKAIAVLEINPVTKGHTIIIPKKSVKENDLPTQAFSLAKKVAKKIKSKFKCQKINISTSEILGEGIIQVLPVYNNEDLGMSRRKAEESELKAHKEILETKKKEKSGKLIKPQKEKYGKKSSSKKEIKLPKAPIRIP